MLEFFQDRFTGQFAYTGCFAPPTKTPANTATGTGSANQKTSVVALTASTVVSTNLAQPQVQVPSSNGGSSGNPGTSNGNPQGNGGNSGTNGNGGSSGGSSNSGPAPSQNIGAVIISALGFGSPAPAAATPQGGNPGSSGNNNNNNNNNNAPGSPGSLPAGGQSVTIGGNTVVAVPTTVANGAPAVVVNGQTATFGQTITVEGTPVVVSGSSNSPQLLVGGGPGGGSVQTIALQTPAPATEGKAVATTVNGQPAVVLDGITATVGQSVTLNGKTGVVVTSGSVTEIVFSSGSGSPSTSIIAPAVSTLQTSAAATKPAAPGATPSATLTAIATTVSGKPAVVVGSITASVGQTVTINGTPVVVTTSGSSTELIFGGTSTSFLPKVTQNSSAVRHRWSGGMLGGIIALVFVLFW